jgi:uncharacterized protein (DUF2141 family)
MARWQRRYLARQLVRSSDAETYPRQLPKSGILSGLELRVAITNGSTGGGGEDVIDAIDRIEVIGNGSEVLFSLEGIELDKWAQFWTKRLMAQNRDDRNAEVQFAMFPVMFGRWLGDNELWLDLSAWTDVELRVQFSPTISAAAFVTGTVTIDIITWMYEHGAQPPSFSGWLRTTQVKAFTSLASGDEPVILSRRFPYANIMVYAFEAGIADGVDISQIELSIDNGRLIPYTGRWLDIQDENAQMFGIESWLDMYAQRADNETIETRLGRVKSAILQVEQDLAAAADFTLANVASIAGGRLTTHSFIVEGSATYAATILQTTDGDMHVQARGFGVGNAIVLPFMPGGDIGAVLPAPTFDELTLTLTQAAAGAAVRVSTQELVASRDLS